MADEHQPQPTEQANHGSTSAPDTAAGDMAAANTLTGSTIAQQQQQQQPTEGEEEPQPTTPFSHPPPTSHSPSPPTRSSPPPPPVPETDRGLLKLVMSEALIRDRQAGAARLDGTGARDGAAAAAALELDDIFQVPALAALRLLGAGIEGLVTVTGDIPPTPPPESPSVPRMLGIQAEKQSIVRSLSEKSLARLLRQGKRSPMHHQRHNPRHEQAPSIDGVRFRHAAAMPPSPLQHSTSEQTIQGSSPTAPNDDDDTTSPTTGADFGVVSDDEPYILVGANSQPLNAQHSALTRRFYSKQPPPIGITDYLLRMHRFCPMSTAVYLAASLYLHRLAVCPDQGRAIAVTPRNAHRLLLAGLRVAMKALEDLSYPHARVARVGGVTETELARLEISFCFLAGFELSVGEPALRRQWDLLRAGEGGWGAGRRAGGFAGAAGLNLEIPKGRLAGSR